MRHCIDTLLPGGDEVEILIVDDGSTKDHTAQIADEYEARYPGICRAIHQENGGHGRRPSMRDFALQPVFISRLWTAMTGSMRRHMHRCFRHSASLLWENRPLTC